MAEEFAEVRERSKRMAAADRRLRRELVERRRTAGLTQQDVASLLGMELEEVMDFERYDSDPLSSEVRRYANAVGAVVTHTIEPAADEEAQPAKKSSVTESALRHSVYFFKRYRWMWLSVAILTHLLLPVATLGFVGLLPWLSAPLALSIYLMLFGFHLTIFVAGRWELRDTPEGLDGTHSGLEPRKKKAP